MSYNNNMDILHPAIIHFPIGLLSLYSILELVSLIRPLRQNLFTTKLILVVSGSVWAQIARMTGEHDEKYFTQDSPILELHEGLSIYVVLLFGVLALSYLLQLMTSKKKNTRASLNIITHQVSRSLVALLGLITLMIVGALGGALVHGPEADPFVRFVTSLLGLR